MTRKTILITGATDGIGLATAIALGRAGHRIVLHGRSEDRLALSLNEVQDASGSDDHATVQADLASLQEVSSMARILRERGEPLHALVNNAGVYLKDGRLTLDGFETTFAVNHLAHFLLTLDLLALLRKGRPARIINVSSVAHRRGHIDYDSLGTVNGYGGYEAYAQSKLANVLFTHSLAARLDAVEITANALHPGAISTKLLRAGFSVTGVSPEAGARTPVYLALSPEVESITGRYYVDSEETPAAEHALDNAEAERLWDVSVRMISKVLPDWEPPSF